MKKSRKWQITINNPSEHGLNQEAIVQILDEMNPLYYCFCDETGENGTYHTHIFVQYQNPRNFDAIKNKFSVAHIEYANGTALENRNYIRKEGKYLDSDKKETNHLDTFVEFGELPTDLQGKRTDIARIYEMINDENELSDILREYPSFMRNIKAFSEVRNLKYDDIYKEQFRIIRVIYIHGKSRTGKTRYVLDKHGYANVFRITNYKNPFDTYNYQEVMLFDEFRDSLPIEDMLKYLEGYPLILPCRFNDKRACYLTVYIISNIPLIKQYIETQHKEFETYEAFLNRIDSIIRFTDEGEMVVEYER